MTRRSDGEPKRSKSAEGVKPAQRQKRVETERAIMDAAVRLLERDGVLAGLNLQEVADEAGVNRSLIHQYFGSRRDLLRAALDWAIEQHATEHARARRGSPSQRGSLHFRNVMASPESIRLVALLAIDGDDSFDALAWAEDRIADSERDKAAGLLDGDVDVTAMLLTWDATLVGWSLLRHAAARQFGVPVTSLDKRVYEAMTSRVGARSAPPARRSTAS
jgi:AcrR family transcriptional regulator